MPTADEIDDLAVTTPTLEVRKMELDLSRTKADLNYAPCKGQMVVAIRGEEGVLLVRRHGEQDWSLPSDRIGPNEKVEKSARRVAKEQCGVTLRSVELAGIYDVVWHYADVSIKRLHFVYAALTDDSRCDPSRERGVSDARFFRELPKDFQQDDIHRYALLDCNAK